MFNFIKMVLLDLIQERGEEIIKDIPGYEFKNNAEYNFKSHNQILKTLPKREQIKIMLKYDRKLIKTYVKRLKAKFNHYYIYMLYLDFCEYFQTFI